jgi:two-component system, OmpR family, sensor histidine kinase KdpD
LKRRGERVAERGRLKVFLGAAPGVGKTHAMLEDARARLREGTGVVVGLVDIHGPGDGPALLADFDVLPRRAIGHAWDASELDLDSVLARHPELVLIDDLAHVNAAGSRHAKRWQDVEEIRDAGIDVYSTLNVHHLESLNDVVERIAGLRIADTLPDGVLHAADDIELIDLPPKELLKRFADGRVRVTEELRSVLHRYFSLGALTALRELALRLAAERVDDQMRRHIRRHDIAGPWPGGERLLACIGDGARAFRVVRAAARLAERRRLPWIALHVETGPEDAKPDERRERTARSLRLAEQLGATVIVIRGVKVAEEILAIARAHNVTQIVVGREDGKGWWPARGSITRQLLARRETFDLFVVADHAERRTRPGRPLRLPRGRRASYLGYAVGVLAPAVATAFALALGHWMPLPNVAIVFLLAVLLVASRHGLAAAILASGVSFIALNFFFTEPRFSLTIAEPDGIVTVGFFLAAAVVTANLAARLRAQVDQTRLTVRRTANLYDFNRRISAAIGQDDVLWAVVHHVASTIGGHSLVLMPQGGGLEIMAGYPPEDRLDNASRRAAGWTWEHGSPAGKGTATLAESDWLFLPMRTGRGPVGVLGVQVDPAGGLLAPEMGRLLDTLANQAAVALERTALVGDIEQARVAAEAERLRSALLSSLSHDLRTPLASIFGAATSLHNYDATLVPAQRLELVQTIQEEAERLNRFVQNLLDMTRIGAGSLKPRTDWVDLADIAGAALQRARKMLRRRPIDLDLEAGLPLLQLDALLMEQVFFNLIDNACKYSPEGAAIRIAARRRGEVVAVEVVDRGPGIPAPDRERVFDMFYRVEAGDSQTAGTGLGLAICRGIVEAHGGSIGAVPGPGGQGTAIAFTLPVPELPELPDPVAVRDSQSERS